MDITERDIKSSDSEKQTSASRYEEKQALSKLVKVLKREKPNVRIKGDKELCFITSLAVKKTGEIIVADWRNTRVKVFSPDWQLLSFLDLESLEVAYLAPEICLLDENRAILCMPGINRLHILDVANDRSVSLEKDINLKYRIWSIVPIDHDLVVTCGEFPNILKQATIDGDIKSTVADRDETGQKLFWNITRLSSFGANSEKIAVSDRNKKNVSIVSTNSGEIIHAFSTENKEPSEIAIDRKKHVYVSYRPTKEVYVFSEDLSMSTCLISNLELDPRAMTFSPHKDELLVTYGGESEACDFIDRFTLKIEDSAQ